MMGFLNPLLFSLTVIIVAFILLYFFRKQFETRTISSNLLWEQVMKEWEASPWLDKFQKNLIFWLQLFSLFFLMLALVKPFWYGEGVKGDRLVFIVDLSSSMNVYHGEETIFEQHKKSMKELVSKLDNQEVTLITAGEKPEVIKRNSKNYDDVNQAINSLAVSYEHENLMLATQFARALSDENTEIHLFSDGAEQSQVSKWITDRYIEVHNLNLAVENVSLKSFGVKEVYSGIHGIAIIENQSDKTKEVTFTVESEENILFLSEFEMAPGEEQVISMPSLPKKDFYQARIASIDDYKEDNEETALLLDNQPPVYVWGEVNPFLVRGMESVGVEVIQFSDISQLDVQNDGVILTEDIEVVQNPTSPIIYVENNNRATVEITEKHEQTKDTLLQYVDMSKIYIEKASKSFIDGLDPIVKSGETPLIQKGVVNGFPVVAINFPISQSNWPLHANFPIFLYNSYDWINRQTTYLGYFHPGDERWLNIGQEEDQIDLYTDEGENLYSINLQSNAFKAPQEPGLYQALIGQELYYFSVGLDEREKVIHSSDSYIVNMELLDTNQNDNNKIGIVDVVWFWLSLLALVLLVIEWEVYKRYVAV